MQAPFLSARKNNQFVLNWIWCLFYEIAATTMIWASLDVFLAASERTFSIIYLARRMMKLEKYLGRNLESAVQKVMLS